LKSLVDSAKNGILPGPGRGATQQTVEAGRVVPNERYGCEGCAHGIKGLGSWSADVYLLMVLRRPTYFPLPNLALVTAVTELKQLSRGQNTNELWKWPRLATLSFSGGANAVAVLSCETERPEENDLGGKLAINIVLIRYSRL